MSLAQCSRPGCGAQETAGGPFLTCSRCNTAKYCSAECKKSDECAGHAPCTVQGLQEAADAGPLTATQHQQVAQLIKQHPPGDACTSPEAGITLAALHALRTALTHPPADPLTPPPGLLPANLAKIIADLTPPFPNDIASFPPSGVLLFDAIAAALNALLCHPLRAVLVTHRHIFTSQPNALAPWTPIAAAFGQHARFTRWLVGSFVNAAPASRAAVTEEARRLTAAAGLLSPLPPAPSIIGAEAMVCMGHLSSLAVFLGLGSVSVRGAPLSSARHGMTGCDKVALMVEQMLPLPHVGLGELLKITLDGSEGMCCDALLRRPGALQALARPLEALAADSSLWRTGPYAHHAMILATEVCIWTVSLKGLPGLRQLAQHLARPTIAALDALLQLGRDERDAANAVVHACLMVMTHMAYTAHGQSCMAAAGCAPRWLELAPRWKAQPLVLEQLLLLLQVPFQLPVEMVYFMPLHSGTTQVWRKLDNRAEQRPPLLDKQMGSTVAMDSLATLIEGVKDSNCQALLISLLILLIEHGNGVPLQRPTLDALVAFCRPPLRLLTDSPGRIRIPEMDMFLSKTNARADLAQLYALTVLASWYCPRQQGQSGAAGTAKATGPGRPTAKAPQALLDIMVEWLKLCGTEGGLPHAPGRFEASDRTNLRKAVLTVWYALLNGDHVTAKFLQRHRVHHLWFRLVPLLGDDDEALSMATLIQSAILDVIREHEGGTDLLIPHVAAICAEGGNIDPILALLDRRVAAAQGRRAPLLSLLDDGDPTLEMFVLVTVYFSVATVQDTQAARKLLAAGGVWELYKAVADGMEPELHSELHVGMITTWAALQGALNRRGVVRQRAEAVVRQLGQGTVERVLGSHWLLSDPSLIESWDGNLFLGVFKQGAASSASTAASATAGSRGGSTCAAAGPAAQAAPVGKAAASRVAGKPARDGAGVGGGAAAAAAASGPVRGGAGRCSGQNPGAGTSSDVSGALHGTGGESSTSNTSSAGGGGAVRECCVCHSTPESTFLCSACQSVRYCSRECQKADWKQHKKACKERQSAASIAG